MQVRRHFARSRVLHGSSPFCILAPRAHDLAWSVPRLMNAMCLGVIVEIMVIRLQLSSLLDYMTTLFGIGMHLLFVGRPVKVDVGVPLRTRRVPF